MLTIILTYYYLLGFETVQFGVTVYWRCTGAEHLNITYVYIRMIETTVPTEMSLNIHQTVRYHTGETTVKVQ